MSETTVDEKRVEAALRQFKINKAVFKVCAEYNGGCACLLAGFSAQSANCVERFEIAHAVSLALAAADAVDQGAPSGPGSRLSD
ncbi:hypothetical protein [Methylobacterium oryzisoli]|uniref:hypothetical protein n=1 Tax=Methylobacterium oryzisoli TaxID=3385502 RepID=UPI003891AB65